MLRCWNGLKSGKWRLRKVYDSRSNRNPPGCGAVEAANSRMLARYISKEEVLGTVHGVVLTADAHHVQLVVHREGEEPDDDEAGVRLLSS